MDIDGKAKRLLYCEAIFGFTGGSRDCTTHTQDEAIEIDKFDSEDCGKFPENGNWTALISDKDYDKINESVTEIMVNSNDEVESDNESTASIFEPGIFPQISAQNNSREIFVFNYKITKKYQLNKDTIIPCLPIFQGDLNPDEHLADTNQSPDLMNNIINNYSLTALESEFSCISILKDKLYN